ncbi:uncharacterized protein LOC123709797 [Pieris brassicae]|uniref:uncharacterized protein LOC123709797 n=1 Tax=Pieris brassicae TaxID=7116 RepID=UPI001E661801|nr:uncharacterized protein LOC123709797 [Pieris brassicae]
MGSIISHLLHFSENIFVCITCSSLVTCLVVTIAMTLLLGIGLGYNYCFIDFKSNHSYVPARYEYKESTPYWQAGNDDEYYDKESNESNPIKAKKGTNGTVRLNYNSNDTRIPQPDNLNESLRNQSFFEFMRKKGQVNELIQPEEKHKAIEKDYNITDVLQNSKIVIPMSDLDLISLLSKWRAENRNYSLQVVVT